jgi:hypothetical protein
MSDPLYKKFLNADSWEQRCEMIGRKALALQEGVPPEFNLAPTLELVSRAWYMGFDLVRTDSASESPKS